jgi:tRNA A37 threonylcarbamoyladenosine dehydratase
VRVSDLAVTSHDRLLQKVRETLRKDFGFPRGEKKFGVECVHSPEFPVFPQCDGGVGAKREQGSDLRLNCESGFGTAAFVTGTFGFVAAGVVVQRLAAEKNVSTLAQHTAK